MGVKDVHVDAERELPSDLGEVPVLRGEVQFGWLMLHIALELFETRSPPTHLFYALRPS